MDKSKEQLEADYKLQKAALNKRITDLEKQMADVSEEKKSEMQGMIKDIKAKLNEAQDRGEEVTESASNKWDSIKDALSKAESRMEYNVGKLKKELQDAIS